MGIIPLLSLIAATLLSLGLIAVIFRKFVWTPKHEEIALRSRMEAEGLKLVSASIPDASYSGPLVVRWKTQVPADQLRAALLNRFKAMAALHVQSVENGSFLIESENRQRLRGGLPHETGFIRAECAFESDGPGSCLTYTIQFERGQAALIAWIIAAAFLLRFFLFRPSPVERQYLPVALVLLGAWLFIQTRLLPHTQIILTQKLFNRLIHESAHEP